MVIFIGVLFLCLLATSRAVQNDGYRFGIWSQTAFVQILALPFTKSVALGMLFNFEVGSGCVCPEVKGGILTYWGVI